jgi:acetyltransferase EpsM
LTAIAGTILADCGDTRAMSDRRPLVILGSSVFAREVADIARAAGYEVAAFAENEDRARCAEPMEGLPVVWVDDLADLASTHHAVGGINLTPLRRRFVRQAGELGVEFATVCHPAAVISPTARVGAGAVIGPGAVVATHARLGEHALVSRGALIGHDTTLGDFVSVLPGANVAGCVTIGDGAFIALGAIVLDMRSVGAHAVVGAGAVVTNDVPERVQVLGVPAREVKRA